MFGGMGMMGMPMPPMGMPLGGMGMGGMGMMPGMMGIGIPGMMGMGMINPMMTGMPGTFTLATSSYRSHPSRFGPSHVVERTVSRSGCRLGLDSSGDLGQG